SGRRLAGIIEVKDDGPPLLHIAQLDTRFQGEGDALPIGTGLCQDGFQSWRQVALQFRRIESGARELQRQTIAILPQGKTGSLPQIESNPAIANMFTAARLDRGGCRWRACASRNRRRLYRCRRLACRRCRHTEINYQIAVIVELPEIDRLSQPQDQ